MRMNLLLLVAALAGCVWDRTGQSASEAWRRDMAIQQTRTQTLQAAVDDALIRVEQIEEVTRARGQDEILRMETVDQLRQEVARLRGDLEVLQHDAGLSSETQGAFQEDAEFRIAWLEARAAALEKNLGLKPPEPPAQADATAAATADAATEGGAGEPTEEGAGEPAAEETPTTPEERLALAREHLDAGRTAPARAILQGLVEGATDQAQLAEMRFLIGETHYKEGQYQSAILAFQEVVDQHGESDRAAWAMLRQGQCFEGLGQRDNAVLFYDDVMRLFPRSKAAKEARSLKSR